MKLAHMYSSVRSTGAKFQWGVGSHKYFSKWNPRFELIDDISIYKRHRKRWKLYAALNYLPIMSRMLRVVHLKLLQN